MIVAAIGILINGGTALLFMRGRERDLNIKGAFLHMAADAAISLGVLVSAFLILKTGWMWLDPLVSLIISAIIVRGTWGLLRDSSIWPCRPCLRASTRARCAAALNAWTASSAFTICTSGR